jgi:glycosyltransferase involved in cell wall biosynthesis
MKQALVLSTSNIESGLSIVLEALKEMGIDPLLMTYRPLEDHVFPCARVKWSPLCPYGHAFPPKLREILALVKTLMLRKGKLVINLVMRELPIPSHIANMHFLPRGLMAYVPYIANSYGLRLSTYDMALSKTYLRLYKLALKCCNVVLANSKFTKRILHEVLGKINCKVLYPPVKVERGYSLSYPKKNWVITISRFSREKRLERIFAISSKIRNAKFIVIGMLDDKGYYQWLAKKAKQLQIDNIELLPNVNRVTLEKLLLSSKVYLHTMPFEHFGIAVVEAMALGTVPVVHKSGGPWEDVLDAKQGLYGYAYEDEEEAVSYVRELLDNEIIRREVAERAFKRSLIYDTQRFKQRFKNIVSTILCS